MSPWNDAVLHDVVDHMTPVSLDEREAILAAPVDRAQHRHYFDRLAALRQIEAGGATRRATLDGPARIICWNVERLRHIDAIADTLRTARADVSLLCEIDRGMARTQNTDRAADLAGRLGQAYLYAAEFIELGLGDVDEQIRHAGEQNLRGFHGAALYSDVEMHQPFLIRLDDRGDWFDGEYKERRVGGTIALGAKVVVEGAPVTLVSVHLESHCDPRTRGEDMRGMLEKVERIAPGEAVLLGGDFNSSTGGFRDWSQREVWLETLRAEPSRLTAPEPYEPLFEAARDFGYEWQACNVASAPTRRRPIDKPGPNHKIDWFFSRGLLATDPQIIPAVQPDGSPSSDHECLAVTVRPR